MTTRHATGTRVFHASYGKGTVEAPTGHTHNDYERVRFDGKGITLRLPIKTLHAISEYDDVQPPVDATGVDCWEAYE